MDDTCRALRNGLTELLGLFLAACLLGCPGNKDSADTETSVETIEVGPGLFEATGNFTGLSASIVSGACAVDGGGLSCWGAVDTRGRPCVNFEPPGTVHEVVVGADWICVLLVDGEVACGNLHGLESVPESLPGEYAAIAHGAGTLCGAGEAGVTCTEPVTCGGAAPSMEGAIGVVVGDTDPPFVCAIDGASTGSCWGAHPLNGCTYTEDDGCECASEEVYQAGPYSDMDENLCGLLLDGTIECPVEGGGIPPEGSFTEIAASSSLGGHKVAVGSDGSLAYWNTDYTDPLALATPDRTFVHADVGIDVTCGIDTDGHVLCWGPEVESWEACE